MSTEKEVLKLKKELREEKHKNKQILYDLSRLEFLLGECIELLDKVGNRSKQQKDSFTAMWCETTIQDIRKTLDLPRFGVDLISWKQIKDTK